MSEQRRVPIGLSRWDVWSLPGAVLAIVLAVDLVAVATVAAGLLRGTELPVGWVPTLAVLLAAGLVSTEATIGVERLRHRSDEIPHIDLSSVWAFAAAALLPGPLSCAVVVVVYAHIYLRVLRRLGIPPHRALFSTATIVLAVQAAGGVLVGVGGPDPFHTLRGLLGVVLALLTYAVVNMTLVVAVIALSGPSRSLRTFAAVMGRGDEAVLEFATLSMGALAAAAVATFGAPYAVLVLPPLIVLHRTVLVRQLEEAASIDGKTGLLNAAAWHVRAAQALRRSDHDGGHTTVLVLDLDHFKDVNDGHGHLVGDQVLAAVATAVRGEVREDDVVGRFGGEEFVVLLPGVEGDDSQAGAAAVAERIRRRIAELSVEVTGVDGPTAVSGLTVSIGGATSPLDGRELSQLLEVADTAMYAAKHAGRNTVRMGVSSAPQW